MYLSRISMNVAFQNKAEQIVFLGIIWSFQGDRKRGKYVLFQVTTVSFT